MSTVITDIYFDAQNQCIVLRSIDGTGALIKTRPQIRLDLTDLDNATAPDGEFFIEAYLRRVHYTSLEDGSKKRCYGLFTIPEDDSTDDGHSDPDQDLYFGGGGGGISYVLTAAGGGDYLTCRKALANGSADPSDTTVYNVAIPTYLRSGHFPTDGGNYGVWRPYRSGDLITGASVDHTQVTVGREELTVIDMNVDGRAVARELHWKDATTCTEYKAWVVMSYPVAAAGSMPS